MIDIVVNTRVLELGGSWQGSDERRARGGVEFPTPLEGEGVIYIHNGDNSTFTIKRREETMPDNVMKII